MIVVPDKIHEQPCGIKKVDCLALIGQFTGVPLEYLKSSAVKVGSLFGHYDVFSCCDARARRKSKIQRIGDAIAVEVNGLCSRV